MLTSLPPPPPSRRVFLEQKHPLTYLPVTCARHRTAAHQVSTECTDWMWALWGWTGNSVTELGTWGKGGAGLMFLTWARCPAGLSVNSCGVLLSTESRDVPALHNKPSSLTPVGQMRGRRQWGTVVFSLLGPVLYYVTETVIIQEPNCWRVFHTYN